jgi:hypothetical protein
MAASFANIKDTSSLGVVGEVAWNCWFCSSGSVFNRHSRREWKTNVCAGDTRCLQVVCKNKDHDQNIAKWLGRVPSAGEERITFSRVLDGRIRHLGSESDKREIRSMLFEFVHESNATENSFLAILNRLTELEKQNTQTILALVVWKRLAQEMADAEPMEPATFQSTKEIRSYLRNQKTKWKNHKESVASAGSFQLVVRLITPFIDWGTGAVKVEEAASGPVRRIRTEDIDVDYRDYFDHEYQDTGYSDDD